MPGPRCEFGVHDGDAKTGILYKNTNSEGTMLVAITRSRGHAEAIEHLDVQTRSVKSANHSGPANA